MKEKLILLVEDSEKVQNYNRRMLEDEGFAVETAMTLAAARLFLETGKPDIIILDIGMPDGNGLDFLRELRQTSKIPVLMLTGYGESKDVVIGFKSGCDDYMPKPYTFDELLVRLERLLKNGEEIPKTIVKGSLKLDLLSTQAFVNNTDLVLTGKEFALLFLLVQNEGETMSAENLYETVWKQSLVGGNPTLRKHISEIRSKLESHVSGYTISNVRGGGYCFESTSGQPENQ
jgi:DNA-binding response OmpR family regulator